MGGGGGFKSNLFAICFLYSFPDFLDLTVYYFISCTLEGYNCFKQLVVIFLSFKVHWRFWICEYVVYHQVWKIYNHCLFNLFFFFYFLLLWGFHLSIYLAYWSFPAAHWCSVSFFFSFSVFLPLFWIVSITGSSSSIFFPLCYLIPSSLFSISDMTTFLSLDIWLG